MVVSQNPKYVSKAFAKSLWNEYRIYDDRLELRAWFLFTTLVIPFDELVSIGVFKPPVIRTVFWAVKLDWADLFEHVGITRTNGWAKKVRFTPRNPSEFVAKLKECSGIE